MDTQIPSLSTTSSSPPSSSSPLSSPYSPFHARILPFSSFLLKSKPMQLTDQDHHHAEENGEPSSSLPESSNINAQLRFLDIDWNDMEKLFDRLATTGKGPQPTLKPSDFCFCIGMQRTPEFANELLRALKGRRRDQNFGITKGELHGYWRRMTDTCFASRLKIFFDICDRDMDGRIDERDIKQAIMISASMNKLSQTHEDALEYAALIMEVLDAEDRGYVEPCQLAALFNFTKVRSPRALRASVCQENHHIDTHQEPMSKAEVLFRTYWRRGWIILVWLVLCFSLFTWKFIQYSNRTAFQVMGYCLCTAKGAAETLKLNMALVLLPVCRNTITRLRRNPRINSFVPFNDNINFHKLVAGGIAIGVILHGGTHLACDFPRISSSDSSTFGQTIASRFGYHQPSYVQILATTEAATGIAMVVLMTIAFLLATKWPRRQAPSLPRSIRQVTGYNTFWYSHHLLIIVYALLVVHSMFLFLTNSLLEKTTWMYIAVPVVLYTGERTFRIIRSGFYQVEILQAKIHPGKVLSLKLQKPEGFKYKSGMYIFMQCPEISPFQWHPFSLTSGPEDDYLSVHIRALGDWSYQINSCLQEAILSGANEYPKIYIDGPYGSASQDHIKYDIIMLVGLGIGATPFISILKDVARGPQKKFMRTDHDGECSHPRGPLKAYFYWVTREQSSFDWFRDALEEISTVNQNQPVIEMHKYLSSVHQEGDARSVLITAIQSLYQAKYGIDIVSWTKVHTRFGRPNWFSIFSKLVKRHRGEKIEYQVSNSPTPESRFYARITYEIFSFIGPLWVFYCGPSELAEELERLCTKFSSRTTTRFVFHKENF